MHKTRMKVVTVSTTNPEETTKPELQQWIASAETHGFDYEILGIGVQWKGFATKTSLVLDFLQKQPPHELVAVVDCWDFLWLRGPDAVQHAYESYATPVVIGSETRCGFNCTPSSCKDRQNNPNGGFAMGTAASLQKMYAFILENSPEDDQVGMGMYRNANCEEVALDVDCRLVVNVNALSPYRRSVELNKGTRTLTFKPKNTRPCAVHLPFQMSDFGLRYYFFRRFLFPKNKHTYGTGYWTREFMKHCVKNYRNNSTLRRTTNAAGAAILSTLVIVCAVLWMRRRPN